MFYSLELKPESLILILLPPLIASGLAFAVWSFGVRSESLGRPAPWKWLALVPVLVGFWIGTEALRVLLDRAYSLYGLSRRFTACYVLACVAPFLTLGGIIWWHLALKREHSRW